MALCKVDGELVEPVKLNRFTFAFVKGLFEVKGERLREFERT